MSEENQKNHRTKILAGSSNQPLAQAVCNFLKCPLAKISLRRFADTETFIEIEENVRGQEVFFLQSTSRPANDHLIELLLALDALRRGSARCLTAVIPYYGYARQDRKTGPRTPISAKMVANLLTTAGADRVLTMDLHAGQIQGFFDIPTDNLFASTSLHPGHRKENRTTKPHIGLPRRRRSSTRKSPRQKLGGTLAIIDKRREHPGVSEVAHIIGEVETDCASWWKISPTPQARSAMRQRQSIRQEENASGPMQHMASCHLPRWSASPPLRSSTSP